MTIRMAYEMVMPYHLHMPSYFLETFTEYPYLNNMMKKLRLLFVLLWMTSNLFSSPVTGLLERIDKGASSKFIIERQKSETDFFELDQKGDKVIIRGNDYVNIATGLNWYLKY